MMNFFSFCLTGKLFLSSPILNDSLTEYSILSWRFFSSQNFQYIMPFLSACTISAEKSSDSHMAVPLYIKSCFSPSAFNTLGLKVYILSIICLVVDLFGFIFFRILCASWIWMCILFPRLEKFPANTSSNKFPNTFLYLLFFFSGTPIIHMLFCLMLCHKSLKVSSVTNFFLLLLWLGDFHCPIFQVANPFFYCISSPVETL